MDVHEPYAPPDYKDQKELIYLLLKYQFSTDKVTSKELQKIIEENDYKIIHCHTPMGGVLSRLAAIRARKNGTKVIYTAHGFHFCNGAPVLNWLLYYPIERLLASQTDCLITINNEDYS